MELTLVDTCHVECTTNKWSSVSFKEVPVRLALTSKVSTGCADIHCVQQNLILSQLMTRGNCALKVGLFQLLSNSAPSVPLHEERKTCYLLKLKCTTPSNNILKRLWDEFHDDVKVSVSVQRLPRDPFGHGDNNIGQHPFFKTEGMAISSTKYKCQSDLKFPNVNAALNFAKYNFNMQMIITASFPKEILSNMRNLIRIDIPQTILKEGLAHDVVIIAENGEEIKAHKNFLFAWSTTFGAMIQNGLEESQTSRLDMSDMSELGITAFLRFLYYQDLAGPNQNADIAYEMLYAAHKYEVTALEQLMHNLLLETADKDFCAILALKIYCLVRNIEYAAQLKTKMIGILRMKIEEVHELPEYKELFKKNLEDAMELSYQLAKATLK